jgi:hypothetical protein
MNKCKECGNHIPDVDITHCSNQCLFENLKNSKSISGSPIETWDEDEPWV